MIRETSGFELRPGQPGRARPRLILALAALLLVAVAGYLVVRRDSALPDYAFPWVYPMNWQSPAGRSPILAV